MEIGAVSGTVTMIGLSYSTLATVENKEVYIPNSQLSSATIINYTRLGRRRMEITVSASYSDKAGGCEGRPAGRGWTSSPPFFRTPPRRSACAGTGTADVNYLIRAWTATGDYWDTYYRLLEALLPAFQRRAVSMPYPQMDVHLIPDGDASKKSP